MSRFADLIMQHTGLPAGHESGECTILPNKGKACLIEDWSNLYKLDHPNRPTLKDLSEWEHDFGRLLGIYFNGDYDLVLDIDSDPKTAEIIVGYILKNQVLADHACIIKTASGKFHCDFRVTGESPEGKHNFSKKWDFPYDFPVEEHRNEWLGSKIEMQTSGQEAFVGTIIDGKPYVVDERSKIKDITKLPTIEYSELIKQLEKVMLLNGFTTHTPDIAPSASELASKANVSFIKPTDKQNIAHYHMNPFAKFLINILEHNDGNKHRIILALGNYFSEFVKKESAIKLMETIIRLAPTLFKSNEDAMRTLLKGYDSANENKHKTGLRTIFKEYASDFMTAQQFYFPVIWYSGAMRVGFHPTGMQGNQYKYIEFNRWTKQIEEQTIKHRKNKEGEYEPYTDSVRPVFGFELVGIKRIENSLIPSANAEYELQYIPTGMNRIHIIRGNTMKEIRDKLKSHIGIDLGGSSDKIFNQIVAFFTRNNLIEIANTSPVRGIFIINGELRRFNDNLEEINVGFDKQKLVNALDLLEDIRDILPMDSDKMGNIVRKGLKMPFQFILSKKGKMRKYLSLLGVGKSWKTGLAELNVNLYSPSKNTNDGNIFVAGSASSPYQFGRLFTLGSTPIVINECAKIFTDPELIEIMKSAVDSDIARSTNDAIYFSFSPMIFTSNVDMVMKDAIVRRSDIFYFHPSERLSEDDISKLAELLNKTGTNSRLVELNEIGQFVFTFLHDNLNLFDECKTSDEFELKLIEAIEQETGRNLDWLKQSVSEDTEELIEEIDNETISDFLGEIKKQYNYYHRNLINAEYTDTNGMYYKPLMFSAVNLVTLVSRGMIDFLVYDNNCDEIFIISSRLKSFFSRQGKLVTAKQIYEELEKITEDGLVRERRMKVEGKYVRGVGVDVDLLIDLLNNNTEKTESKKETDGLTDEEEELFAKLLAKKRQVQSD